MHRRCSMSRRDSLRLTESIRAAAAAGRESLVNRHFVKLRGMCSTMKGNIVMTGFLSSFARAFTCPFLSLHFFLFIVGSTWRAFVRHYIYICCVHSPHNKESFYALENILARHYVLEETIRFC